MPSTSDPPPGVIDLTNSDDDDDDNLPHRPSVLAASHVQNIPIPRPIPPRPFNNVSQIYTSVAQEPYLPSNHGLPNNGFYSRGPWSQPQSLQHPVASTHFAVPRSGGENPAKRIRVGERPLNLASSYVPATGAAMPEVPLNLVDREFHRIGTLVPEQIESAHHALNVFSAAANINRPRKPMPRNEIPSSSRQRQTALPGIRNMNERANSTVSDAKMKVVLVVKKSLQEFGSGSPGEDIIRAGKEVMDKICDFETLNTILSNNGSTSVEFEEQLANRARALTEQQLDMARNRRNKEAGYGDQFASSLGRFYYDNSTSHQLHLGPHQPPQISGPRTRQLPSSGEVSSSSSEVDGVFDRNVFMNERSPTTSPELSTESDKSEPRRPDPPASEKGKNTKGALRQSRAGVSLQDDSSVSEESSDDEDITADIRDFLRTLKTPSAVTSPVKTNFDEVLPPSVTLLQSKLKRRKLERDERLYRLFGLDIGSSRPYLSAQYRSDLQRGLAVANNPKSRFYLLLDERQQLRDAVLHVDFAGEEMAYMADVIAMFLGIKIPPERRKHATLKEEITRMMKGRRRDILKIVSLISFDRDKPNLPLALRLVKRRGKAAVTAFLQDAAAGTIAGKPKLVECPGRRVHAALHASEEALINSLLRQREVSGRYRSSGSQKEVKTVLSDLVEDSIVPYRQWMDCSGDVIALAWNTEGTSFVCGATAHSDSHNQQYNKPGNLIFGSITSEVMRARPDHKIPRPVVVKGDNSLEAMRETQDPWLYSSVVSAAYSSDSDTFFTSSFDKTVKVWGKGADETQPELLATWEHKGNVNFVVTSENHGLVATASDIVRDAIRVYEVDEKDVANSPFRTYYGVKANEQVAKDNTTWAYFPATIAWAKYPLVSHLLLVGYSPRSTSINDSDIPENKRDFGELCLWNVETNERIDIWPRSQNVFEVVWHPTQPVFLAATAPSGMCEPWVRTQVRVFALNEKGGFTQTKSLDCCAIDINEITVMPNSLVSCYVTASCTDGKVYVWDTALGDQPVHVLEHGVSIDDRHCIDLPNELSDNGVKFAAWGASLGRFYTGSSDGLVKAWDVRAPRGRAFIRDVVRLSGGVSAGAFSPDLTHLLIGDATGKIHLLQIKDTEATEEATKVFPKLVTPHPQPDEDSMWAGRGGEISAELIQKGVVTISKNREVGAVQGPAYHIMNWYCPSAHVDADPTKPLLSEYARKQQILVTRAKEELCLVRLPKVTESLLARFSKRRNYGVDLKGLEEETLAIVLHERWVHEDDYKELSEDEYLPVGGRLIKKLRKGEDWEDDWVELEDSEWVDLDSIES